MKDYFFIESETIEGLTGRFAVRLNPACEVYKGHFPDEPVSPGVCNIAMLLSCAEMVIGFPLRATKINRCRLTTLITPLSHAELELDIDLKEKEPERWVLTARIGKGENDYLTLKAEVIRDSE